MKTFQVRLILEEVDDETPVKMILETVASFPDIVNARICYYDLEPTLTILGTGAI